MIISIYLCVKINAVFDFCVCVTSSWCLYIIKSYWLGSQLFL